jgi:hypothetical protein
MVYFAACVYRDVRFIQNADGTPVFADRPVLDVNGKPMVNSAGEAYAVERGAIRTLQVHGDCQAFQCFSQIAREAGCSVPAMMPEARKLLFPDTVRETDPLKCWLYALFDLAWRNTPGSPLKAERHTWVGNTSVSLRSLPHLRRAAAAGAMVAPSELLAQVPDPPDRFYSILGDLWTASIAAIDILSASSAAEAPKPLDAKELTVMSAIPCPDASASPNAELFSLADTQIRLKMAEQGDRLQRAIAQGMAEANARGLLHSSITLNMIIEHCCDAIAERGQLAWATIQEHIAAAGIVCFDGLNTQLRQAVAAHIPEGHGDVAAIMERYLKRIQLRGAHMREAERLDAAREKALAEAYGAVDLFVLSVRGKEARGAQGSRNVNIAVNAPVAALQIGNSNVASVVQRWTVGKRDELLEALGRIEDGIRSEQIPDSVLQEQLRTLVREAQAEARQDNPNISRLKLCLSQLATAIRTVAALKPAWMTLVEIANWLGRAVP